MTTKDQIAIAGLLTEMYNQVPDLNGALTLAVKEYGKENVRRATNPNGVVEVMVRHPEEGWIVFWDENEVDDMGSQDQHFGNSLN